jgi:excisionase family DNA binding protein
VPHQVPRSTRHRLVMSVRRDASGRSRSREGRRAGAVSEARVRDRSRLRGSARSRAGVTGREGPPVLDEAARTARPPRSDRRLPLLASPSRVLPCQGGSHGSVKVVVLRYMLTVPQAAQRVGRDPETVRRWIRTGKLRAERVGTQHMIEEAELDQLSSVGSRRLPKPWRRTVTGRPQPDWVRILHRARRSH